MCTSKPDEPKTPTPSADGLDAYVNEGMSFDTCRGHADGTGNYHYHALPGTGCVYNDTNGRCDRTCATVVECDD
jgi:hypothetical protein